MSTSDLSVKSLIRAVTEELLASRLERVSQGEQALFEIDELVIDVSFVVTQTAGGSAGFDLKVIKADANTKYDDQSVHKISLKLKAVRSTALAELGDELPLRPRTDD